MSCFQDDSAETIPYDRHSNIMLRLIPLCSLLCVVPLRASAQQTPHHAQLRIGLITPGGQTGPEVASIVRGVRLGAAESRQTAQLFGDDVELFEAEGAGAGAIAAANRLLATNKIEILLGASTADVEALARFSEAHHILFLNAASRSQSLRSACYRHTFHVEAADAMYSSAGQQSRVAPSPSRTASTGLRGARADSVVLWSSLLERFGAGQINDRYRDKYSAAMDGAAWAGWAAVKFGAEAALRVHSASPARLLAYLESPTTQFDGHKGWPLTFRFSDHQLRQPLYMVFAPLAGNSKPSVRDIPDLRAQESPNSSMEGKERPSDRVLDSLMGPDAVTCPWSKGR